MTRGVRLIHPEDRQNQAHYISGAEVFLEMFSVLDEPCNKDDGGRQMGSEELIPVISASNASFCCWFLCLI
jgi:hypothetical protein